MKPLSWEQNRRLKWKPQQEHTQRYFCENGTFSLCYCAVEVSWTDSWQNKQQNCHRRQNDWEKSHIKQNAN